MRRDANYDRYDVNNDGGGVWNTIFDDVSWIITPFLKKNQIKNS